MAEEKTHIPRKIQIRGARVHNLKNIDVDIPLNQIVGIAGIGEFVQIDYPALGVSLYKQSDHVRADEACTSGDEYVSVLHLCFSLTVVLLCSGTRPAPAATVSALSPPALCAAWTERCMPDAVPQRRTVRW